MSFRPEIKDDEFFYAIIDEIVAMRPKTLVEIGSANGLGSTQAFLEGMRRIDNGGQLFCFELDSERYRELVVNTGDNPYVSCLQASPLPDTMTGGEICAFLEAHPEMLVAKYGEDEVLGWKEHTDREMRRLPTNGLRMIDKLFERPCIALVDGSPFSGLQETRALANYGFDVIMLDDTSDIKCHDAYRFLAAHGYEVFKENPNLRNGYAIFRRKA